MLTKCAGACGDPSIKLRHHHLQGQIQRVQPATAVAPSLAVTTAGEQLENRAVQVLPERTAETSVFSANGGKCGGSDDHLGVLTQKQIPDAGLHRDIAQTADPDESRPQTSLPQSLCQVFGEARVSRLKQSSVKDNTHGGTAVVTPVPGKWIRQGFNDDVSGFWRLVPMEQRIQRSEHLVQIRGTPLSQKRSQTVGKGGINGSNRMQFSVLLDRARQNEQLPHRSALLPALQLFQSVAPVPSAAQKSHQDQLS